MISEGALAFALADAANGYGNRGLLYVGGDAGLIARLAAMACGFAPGLEVIELPPWDNLPYDRARPSRGVTGRRVAALASLASPAAGPRLVLTTPESLLQRLPPRERLRECEVNLAVGEPLDPDWLEATLRGFGYRFEELVDEPGEAAIRGAVIDLYPADATAPCRLDLLDGRIDALRAFDSLSQRSTQALQALRLRPASEAFTVPGEALPGSMEALLPDGPLETLFDYCGTAKLVLSEADEARLWDWAVLVRDSHALRQSTAATDDPVLPLPDRLYLKPDEARSLLASRRRIGLQLAEAPEEVAAPLPSAAAAAARIRSIRHDAVVLFAAGEAPTWQARLQRRLHRQIGLLPDWQSAAGLQPGDIGIVPLPLSQGFLLPGQTLLALQRSGERRPASEAVLQRLTLDMRIGDLVVEPDHGMARLTGLESLGDPVQSECLVLTFAEGRRLLVPAQEVSRVWRYGAEETLKPDRLQGPTWLTRRQQVEAEIEVTARELLTRVRQRQAARVPVVRPGADYQRFARRVPFQPTADQRAAIRAMLDDLAREQPMHRLICGDVGYGKTEVALHAAAVAALGGQQVAIIAPTTILARQHLDTFRQRLHGFGLVIEPLMHAAGSAAGRATLRGLADGSIDIVVGTHAIAARRVKFARLGLLVIDEEQRFGEAHKRALRSMQGGTNTLAMTATPLPRSLQAALAGLVDISLLTEFPIAREPVRTFVMPFDLPVVRAALLREARRGGQSFVVCPRIEDIEPLQARLRDAIPELSMAVLHGRLPAETLGKTMSDFSAGRFGVLLTTNIVEAGLNLPNANTMVVWRADRFGLAQLHQLRGRVGRGRTRAVAYLLTDPSRPPAAAARKRLQTLAALEGRGAGFAISAADLDQRGAGDLLGEKQAGHMRLLGTELYRHLIVRALRHAQGEPDSADGMPAVSLDVPAYIPGALIPDPDLRLEIYRRIAALPEPGALPDMTDEFIDRFGELPQPFVSLLSLARLRLLCRALAVHEVQAGPRSVALRFATGTKPRLVNGVWKNGRYLMPIAESDPQKRLTLLTQALAAAMDEGRPCPDSADSASARPGQEDSNAELTRDAKRTRYEAVNSQRIMRRQAERSLGHDSLAARIPWLQGSLRDQTAQANSLHRSAGNHPELTVCSLKARAMPCPVATHAPTTW